MNRPEGERLAALEVEMKHMAKAHEEMAEALAALRTELAAMRKEQAAIYNQFTGGRKTLAAVLFAAGSAGASVMWFLKEFLPFFQRGP